MDAGGGDVDEDLARSGDRVVDLLPAQVLGRAELVQSDRVHGATVGLRAHLKSRAVARRRHARHPPDVAHRHHTPLLALALPGGLARRASSRLTLSQASGASRAPRPAAPERALDARARPRRTHHRPHSLQPDTHDARRRQADRGPRAGGHRLRLRTAGGASLAIHDALHDSRDPPRPRPPRGGSGPCRRGLREGVRPRRRRARHERARRDEPRDARSPTRTWTPFRRCSSARRCAATCAARTPSRRPTSSA